MGQNIVSQVTTIFDSTVHNKKFIIKFSILFDRFSIILFLWKIEKKGLFDHVVNSELPQNKLRPYSLFEKKIFQFGKMRLRGGLQFYCKLKSGHYTNILKIRKRLYIIYKRKMITFGTKLLKFPYLNWSLFSK